MIYFRQNLTAVCTSDKDNIIIFSDANRQKNRQHNLPSPGNEQGFFLHFSSRIIAIIVFIFERPHWPPSSRLVVSP
jgi:hypothetical protein